MSEESLPPNAVTLPASLAGRSCATQWFGPVAMHTPVFSMMWGLVQRMDLEAVAATPIEKRSEEGGRRYRVNGGIAVLPISGPVSKEDSSMSAMFGGVSTVRLRAALQQAVDDSAVHTILLHVDSPGGTVPGVGDLADDILAARKKKDVAVYCEDLCASAAYWLASQGTPGKVFASRHAELGSIGVFTGIYDLSEMAKMEGVKAILVSSGGIKGAHMPGNPVPEALVAEMQKGVDRVNALFLEAVARGRGISLEQAKKLNTGQLWGAKDAKRLGLIDDVQPLSKVLAMLRQDTPAKGHANLVSASADEGRTWSPALLGASLPSWSRDVLLHLEVAAMQAIDESPDIDVYTPAAPAEVPDDAPSEEQYEERALSSNEGSEEPIVTDEAQTMSTTPPPGTPAPATPAVGAGGAPPVVEPSVPLKEVEAIVNRATAPLKQQVEALQNDKDVAAAQRIDDKRQRIALKHKVSAESLSDYTTEKQLDGIDKMLASRSSGTHLDLVTLASDDPYAKRAQDDEKERQAWLKATADFGTIRRA